MSQLIINFLAGKVIEKSDTERGTQIVAQVDEKTYRGTVGHNAGAHIEIGSDIHVHVGDGGAKVYGFATNYVEAN